MGTQTDLPLGQANSAMGEWKNRQITHAPAPPCRMCGDTGVVPSGDLRKPVNYGYSCPSCGMGLIHAMTGLSVGA